MTELHWVRHGKRAWAAEDGHGGYYHVERFLGSWVLVHTMGQTDTAVRWPAGMPHNLKNGMAVCQSLAREGEER